MIVALLFTYYHSLAQQPKSKRITEETIKFQPGSIVTTVGAIQVASQHQMLELLRRHLAGDWGEVTPADAAANERALKHGDRLLSVYDVDGEKLWVITEADRSSTCLLLPSEY